MLFFASTAAAQVVIEERLEIQPKPERQAVQVSGLAAESSTTGITAPVSGELRIRFRNANVKAFGSVWPSLEGRRLQVVYQEQVYEEEVTSRFSYVREYTNCYRTWRGSCCLKETFYTPFPTLISSYSFVYKRSFHAGREQEASAVLNLGRIEAGDPIELTLAYLVGEQVHVLDPQVVAPEVLQGDQKRLIDNGGARLTVVEGPLDRAPLWGMLAAYEGAYAACVGGWDDYLEVAVEIVPAESGLDHFELYLTESPLRHGRMAEVFVQAKDAAGEDVEISGDTYLTFSVVQAEALGGLKRSISGVAQQKQDHVPYGSVRRKKAGASGLLLDASGTNPIGWSSLDRRMSIYVATMGGPQKFGVKQVEIREDYLFGVVPEADTVAFGDSTIVRIQAKDRETGAVLEAVPGSTPVRFVLVGDDANYARVAPGDTTYGYARSKGIAFFAEGTRPDSLIDVELRVYRPGDPGLSGKADLVVENRLKVEFEFAGDRKVWPEIPKGGAMSVFDFESVDDTIGVVVRVTDRDVPLVGQDVELRADWVTDSGGHAHLGKVCKADSTILRPAQETLDTFTVSHPSAGYDEKKKGTILARTDAEGAVRLHYQAPQFGGDVVLKASTVYEGYEQEEADTLEVSVPELVWLPDSTDLYVKLGGTSAHRGPRGQGQSRYEDMNYPDSREPDDSHYGNPVFVDTLISIAEEWKAMADAGEIDARQAPLGINDLSLPRGGLFDVCGWWKPSHNFHRVGRDADIRTVRDLSTRNGVLLTPVIGVDGKTVVVSGKPLYENAEFEELAEDKGANKETNVHSLGTSNEHYHVYFYPVNQEED